MGQTGRPGPRATTTTSFAPHGSACGGGFGYVAPSAVRPAATASLLPQQMLLTNPLAVIEAGAA